MHRDRPEVWKLRTRSLDLSDRPQVMGNLNVTPDSFSDGGKFYKTKIAKRQINYLFKCGADIVDVGGESTRPGSRSISSKIEWNRIFPSKNCN